MKRAAERTRDLRAHFLPRDPLKRGPEVRRRRRRSSGSERRARRLGATAEPTRRAAGTLMGGLGGRREPAHNATPAADYRTALLSDSP